MNHRVIVRESLHQALAGHLLSGFRRGRFQEEACFALWRRGDGLNRFTAILGEVILPESRDRALHGTVTLSTGYINRALDFALQANAGVAVLHSHPSSGWQAMSEIDYETERSIIAPFVRETQLPLLGMTMSGNGVWSARIWQSSGNDFNPIDCAAVRRVGPRFTKADSSPDAYPPYQRRPSMVRTLDSWGVQAQTQLARTHVCVVGAGSVGSIVLESLARTGFEQITIVDPDRIEEKNLDRLLYASRDCLGLQKALVAKEHIRAIGTANKPVVRAVPLSIRTKTAYQLASDADVIFSCVDNAEAREVLNYISYSNCLPLIDGGVLVDSNERMLSTKWRVQLVGPGMRCLRCRGQYTTSDARDERIGFRRRGRYINEGEDDGPEPGQNTFAFCNSVAAEEIRILIRYLIGQDWWHDKRPTSGQWSLEHRFVEAESEWFEHPDQCASTCEFAHKRLGLGTQGRPAYPFVEEQRIGFRDRLLHRSWRARMRVRRLATALLG